jgi:hypothetical protein
MGWRLAGPRADLDVVMKTKIPSLISLGTESQLFNPWPSHYDYVETYTILERKIFQAKMCDFHISGSLRKALKMILTMRLNFLLHTNILTILYFDTNCSLGKFLLQIFCYHTHEQDSRNTTYKDLTHSLTACFIQIYL